MGRPFCLTYMTDPEAVARVWQKYTGAFFLCASLLVSVCACACECVPPCHLCACHKPCHHQASFVMHSEVCCTPFCFPCMYVCVCEWRVCGCTPAVFGFVRNPWSRAISSYHFNNKRAIKRPFQGSFANFAAAPSEKGALCRSR
jgi:hypothetical protein